MSFSGRVGVGEKVGEGSERQNKLLSHFGGAIRNHHLWHREPGGVMAVVLCLYWEKAIDVVMVRSAASADILSAW